MICYEDTDPAMARPYGGGGEAQTDFLLNISNDGWFDGTSEHDQHLAICRFRAVECRRSVARPVNMGISRRHRPATAGCWRRGWSRKMQRRQLWEIPEEAASLPVSRWHEYKKVGGVLVGRVPLDDADELLRPPRRLVRRRRAWRLVTLCCVGTVRRRGGADGP